MVNDARDEYDSLLDENLDIQKKVAKGEIRGAQKIIIHIVKSRFPTLKEETHPIVTNIQSMQMLSQLAKQIVVAKDEQMARWVLDTYATHWNQTNHA